MRFLFPSSSSATASDDDDEEEDEEAEEKEEDSFAASPASSLAPVFGASESMNDAKDMQATTLVRDEAREGMEGCDKSASAIC